MTLPGTRLLAFLARRLDEQVVESILVPTVADLQHETLRAGPSVPRRWLALIRGYAAIARLLFWNGLLWRSPMRRLISVLVLGGVGAALVISLDFVINTTVGLGALFLVAMVAAAALRVTNAGGSYRRIFSSCIAAGTIMAAALCVWLILPDNRLPHSWLAYTVFILSLAASVGLGSALVAAVASRPTAGPEPVYQRGLRQVAVATAAFGTGFAVRTVIGGWYPHTLWSTLMMAASAAFVAFFFAAFAFAVYLPVMAVARRAIPRLGSRLPLAVIGALLFPIPLIGIPLLQPPPSPWYFVLPRLSLLLWMSIPYVIAGAVLGWLVAGRPRDSARATS